MTSENLDGVMRRIQKLLAIANDERADPNEAAAAASQAEKAMRKYQIDNAALMAAEMRSKGGGLVARYAFANMKRDDPKRPALQKNPVWAGWLAVPLARLHDCEVRYSFQKSPRGVFEAAVGFFGHEADVTVAAWTFDYLVGALIAAMKQYQSIRREKTESESYRRGFVLAVSAKLHAMRAEKEAELAKHSDSRALMVCKKQAIAEHFGEFKYGKPSAATIRDGRAYAEGREAGSRVDVGRRAVGGSASSTLRLK